MTNHIVVQQVPEKFGLRIPPIGIVPPIDNLHYRP
jgi:hypothetical protein